MLRLRRSLMLSLYTVLAAVLAASALWQLGAGQVAAHATNATMTTPLNPPSPACVNVVNTGGGNCVSGPAILTPPGVGQ